MKSFICLMIFVATVQGLVAAAEPRIPEGWTEGASLPGVRSWHHEFTFELLGKTQTLTESVVTVDLRKAKLRSLIGSAQENVNDPIQGRFTEPYWDAALRNNTADHKLKILLNGSYFSSLDPLLEGLGTAKTTLDFPLKKDGTVLSSGPKAEELPNRRTHLRALCWERDRVAVLDYAPDLLTRMEWSDVVVGIGDGYPVNDTNFTGRNFFGIAAGDRPEESETLVIFVSPAAKQADARANILAFGAEPKRLVMLDGGASSRLMIDGEYVIRGDPITRKLRKFPHMLAIYGNVNE